MSYGVASRFQVSENLIVFPRMKLIGQIKAKKKITKARKDENTKKTG